MENDSPMEVFRFLPQVFHLFERENVVRGEGVLHTEQEQNRKLFPCLGLGDSSVGDFNKVNPHVLFLSVLRSEYANIYTHACTHAHAHTHTHTCTNCRECLEFLDKL